nr:MAG TPA: hypothetical protein [Caudoviricetes sp.]
MRKSFSPLSYFINGVILLYILRVSALNEN